MFPRDQFLVILFFLLNINDLPGCLDKGDTQMFSVELTKNLNNQLKKASEWLISNKLLHHPTKTKLMYIGSKQNLHTMIYDLPVTMNNQLIP